MSTPVREGGDNKDSSPRGPAKEKTGKSRLARITAGDWGDTIPDLFDGASVKKKGGRARELLGSVCRERQERRRLRVWYSYSVVQKTQARRHDKSGAGTGKKGKGRQRKTGITSPGRTDHRAATLAGQKTVGPTREEEADYLPARAPEADPRGGGRPKET